MEIITSIAIIVMILILIFISFIDLRDMRVPMQYFFVLSVLSFVIFLSYFYDIDVKYRFPLSLAYICCIAISYWLGNILVNKGIYGGADVKLFMSVMGLLFIIQPIYSLTYAVWFFVITPAPIICIRLLKLNKHELTKETKYPFIPVMVLVLFIFFYLSQWGLTW